MHSAITALLLNISLAQLGSLRVCPVRVQQKQCTLVIRIDLSLIITAVVKNCNCKTSICCASVFLNCQITVHVHFLWNGGEGGVKGGAGGGGGGGR